MESQSQNIASELQMSELKQSNLYKSYEQLYSQASSSLVFSVQWKDLETHFDSTRKSIQTGIETLSSREKAFALREKELATRESDFESRKKEFESLAVLIVERVKAIELALGHAESLQTLIAEKSSELDRLKGSVEEEEKKLERTEGCVKLTRIKKISLAEKVKQLDEEIASKEREVESIHGSLRGLKNEIASERRVFKELQKHVEAKEERIKACQSSVDTLEKEIYSKDNKLKSVSAKLESKEELVRARQSSIDQLKKEIQSKEDKLKGVLGLIVSCSSELESKETQLVLLRKEVESKEKSLVSLKNSADQIAQACEKRESEIERLAKEFELKEKFFELKLEDRLKEVESIEKNLKTLQISLDQIAQACEKRESEIERLSKEFELKEKSFELKLEDRLKEVESIEKNLRTLQISLKKSFSDLEMKEKEFSKQVIEFESKQKKPDLSRNPNEAREVTVNTIVTASTRTQLIKAEPLECAQNKTSIVTYSASNRNPRTMEGRDLRLLLNWSLKSHDSVCNEVFTILKASANPPKLALDAVEGLFPSKSSEESREFNLSVIRRSCIIVLEQLENVLMEDSRPDIACEVRDQAKRFADSWRAKMKETETNCLEALGFLQFLTSFRLTPEFDPNEIYELRRLTADKTFTIPEIEQATENSLASVMARPPIVEVNTMLNICTILQESKDPAGFVLEYIQSIFSRPFSDTNVLRNCIILFDQLVKTSPQIHPVLREDAMRVAAGWKVNIESRGRSALDLLVFLQFLDTYDLVPSFDVDEILNLLMRISRDTEVLEVCCQVGVAKRIPDIIQNLIQKQNVVDAVRLICAFKLTNKFEPVKLVTKFMDDLKEYNERNCKGVKRPIEEKEMISDEEVSALIAIRDCVMENKTDCSEFPLGLISARIDELEKIRIRRRRTFDKMVRVKADREERNQSPHWPMNSGGKRGDGPRGGFEQGRHKLPRLSLPANQQFQHCPPGYASRPKLCL